MDNFNVPSSQRSSSLSDRLSSEPHPVVSRRVNGSRHLHGRSTTLEYRAQKKLIVHQILNCRVTYLVSLDAWKEGRGGISIAAQWLAPSRCRSSCLAPPACHLSCPLRFGLLPSPRRGRIRGSDRGVQHFLGGSFSAVSRAIFTSQSEKLESGLTKFGNI